MKIAYIMSLSADKLDGIGDKVVGQLSVWRKLGHDARLLSFAPRSGSALKSVVGWIFGMEYPLGNALLGKLFRLFQYLRGLLVLFCWRPDVIYARAGYSPFGCKLWQLFGAKVILEINSDLVKEVENHLETGSLVEAEGQRILGLWKGSLAKCDGMVSVSYQMDEVNVQFLKDQPHTVVWNSVDFREASNFERSNASNRLPKLCFIGSKNFSWNGLDLLKDFAAKMVGKLDFVVIGASDDGLYSENVEIVPYLERDEMLKVLAACDVGLGTLALFRKGLDECSALKARDYALLGIPMILAYKETPFVGEDIPNWILEIPNTEEALNNGAEGIVSFCEEWKGRSFDINEAKPFYHSAYVEKRRLEFFESNLNS